MLRIIVALALLTACQPFAEPVVCEPIVLNPSAEPVTLVCRMEAGCPVCEVVPNEGGDDG